MGFRADLPCRVGSPARDLLAGHGTRIRSASMCRWLVVGEDRVLALRDFSLADRELMLASRFGLRAVKGYCVSPSTVLSSPAWSEVTQYRSNAHGIHRTFSAAYFWAAKYLHRLLPGLVARCI